MKRNSRYGKKIIYAALLFVCLILFMTGCSRAGDSEALQSGMQEIEQLNYAAALESLEKALVGGADPQLVYRGQGIAYMGMTQYDEAINAFQKSLAAAAGANNLEFDTNYYLAAAYAKADKTEEAIQVYSAILNLRPKEKNAWFYRGTQELKTNAYDKAIEDFNKALSQTPSDYSLYINIAVSLSENGYQEAADQYLQDALSREDAGMTDYDRGRLYFYQKDYNNARDCLERAKSGGGAEAILFLGRTHEALGDQNYAASVYANYLAEQPEHPELYNQLGLCRMGMGNYEEAMEAFDAGLAIENNGCIQALTFNKIAAYEHLGEFKKACVMMESYIQTYPDDTQAAREYEFLKTR